jgi:hypothetical protein
LSDPKALLHLPYYYSLVDDHPSRALLASPTIGPRQSAPAAIGEPVRRARRPRSVAHAPLMVPGSAGVVSGVS